MQNDSYSAVEHGGFAMATTALSSIRKSQYQSESVGFDSLYSQNMRTPSSFSFNPYSHFDAETITNMTPDRFFHSQRSNQHQEVVNRHHLCLTHLREAVMEAEALRQENTTLRSVNNELNKHLNNGMFQASFQNRLASCRTNGNPFEIANAFRSMCIETERRESPCGDVDEVGDDRQMNLIENGRNEGMDKQRTSLAKSISVRSNGYLKVSQAGSDGPRPWIASPLGRTRKVYLNGDKKEDEPPELEVYNQGMFKTELCNKWQETGICPFSDHCQFAHGVEELRPVIRHPRYKTECCKMVLSGDVCPYGHRCHFRHALNEEEKLVGAPSSSQGHSRWMGKTSPC